MNSVLIIDDEEIDFLINSKVLSLGKFAGEIKHYSSATSAIRYISDLVKNNSAEWPSHIFIDINMPIMDGFRFIEEFLKITPNKIETKLFILSSSISPLDRERAKEFSLLDNFYSKPLTFQNAEKIFEIEKNS